MDYRELIGETHCEYRLFNGFQDFYFTRDMLFEPQLCMELTQRRIENKLAQLTKEQYNKKSKTE